MILANAMNGLAYPHNGVCYFQSQYGHQAKLGYFRLDSMPFSAVIHLLKGGTLTIVDGTSRDKAMTDGQKYGVATWCRVFNRALRDYTTPVCSWETVAMVEKAHSRIHRPLVHTIRKFVRIYDHKGPAVIGKNVHIVCHRLVKFDDKPELLKQMKADEVK